MGTFNIYTHYDLTILAERFAADIRTRPIGTDPLVPEYLIVQTPGMKKFLSLECARRNTIFTQVTALAPKQFIMKLGFLLLKIREKRSVFERDILPWAIYRVIKDGIEKNVPELSELNSYGGSENSELRLFALAEKTADIFDQYMLYRPGWMKKWKSNGWVFDSDGAHDTNEEWQRYIWRMLIEENKDEEIVSPSDYLEYLLCQLQNPSQELLSRLPKRIFLFGMSLLPPQYLQVFSKLGEVIDVTLYLQVPSIFYFGDVLSDKQILWRQRNVPASADGALDDAASANALLRNLGKMGKDFMDLLLETKGQVQELYDIADAAEEPELTLSLLKRTHWDVLLRNDAARAPIVCSEDSWSIRLASCYGPLREVEVTHDLLLDCFSEDTSLTPADVLIVTPDIELYGPLVQMVFTDARQRCGVRIPFALADQTMLSEDKIAAFAQDLLNTAAGRFEVSAILPLFESASDLSGTPLSMKERELLGRWCEHSGIRWGYDGEFKQRLDLPPEDLLTWRSGIDRLIAGFVMDDEGKMDEGLFPAVEIEGDGAQLLGRLAEFVDSLALITSASAGKHPIHEWNDIIAPLISRLFASKEELPDDDRKAAAAFSGALSTVRERTEVSGTKDEKFPFAIFMQSIVDELSQSVGGRGFFTGNVTVAGMIPMRSIPFKVVVMMGMNRGKFPRHTVRPLFDLMSREVPKPGDRDSLMGDRYVFLESILSAREKLIITWSGFDSSGSSEIPPSVLVDEFRSYLSREYSIEGSTTKAGKYVTVNYPLHPFSGRYQSDTPSDVLLKTWNTKWFAAAGQKFAGAPMFSWTLPPEPTATDEVINGNSILSALADPMNCFLNACRIQDPSYKGSMESSEPFALSGLHKWALKKAIVEQEFADDPDAIDRLAANGGIPPGTPGRIAVEGVKKEIKLHLARIRELDVKPRFEMHRIDRTINGLRYTMELGSVFIKKPDAPGKKNAAATLVDLSETNGKRILTVWISHVFLNLESPTDTTLMLIDQTICLPAISEADAVKHIAALSVLSSQMRERLLPFIPDVSLAFVSAEKGIDDARDKAWRKLYELFGHVFDRDFKLDRRIRDAFEDAEDWETAMNKIPGGEPAFVDIAQKIFGPYAALRGKQ